MDDESVGVRMVAGRDDELVLEEELGLFSEGEEEEAEREDEEEVRGEIGEDTGSGEAEG